VRNNDPLNSLATILKSLVRQDMVSTHLETLSIATKIHLLPLEDEKGLHEVDDLYIKYLNFKDEVERHFILLRQVASSLATITRTGVGVDVLE